MFSKHPEKRCGIFAGSKENVRKNPVSSCFTKTDVFICCRGPGFRSFALFAKAAEDGHGGILGEDVAELVAAGDVADGELCAFEPVSQRHKAYDYVFRSGPVIAIGAQIHRPSVVERHVEAAVFFVRREVESPEALPGRRF